MTQLDIAAADRDVFMRGDGVTPRTFTIGRRDTAYDVIDLDVDHDKLIANGVEVMRKFGLDDLGSLSGAQTITLDEGTYDQKQITLTGDITITFAVTNKGSYGVWLRSADGAAKAITVTNSALVNQLPSKVSSVEGVFVRLEYDGTELFVGDGRRDKSVTNVLDFGAVGDGAADDSAAFQAAIDEGAHVVIPEGSYRVKNILLDKNGLTLHGPQAQLLNNFADGTDTIRLRVSLRKFAIDLGEINNQPNTGHCIAFEDTVARGEIKIAHAVQNEPGKSIVDNGGVGECFFVRFTGQQWTITTSHTVPAFRFVESGSSFNANVLDMLVANRSGSAPWLWLECTGTGTHFYGNRIVVPAWEVMQGGCVYAAGCSNLHIVDASLYDMSLATVSNHMFELDSSTGRECRDCVLENIHRLAGDRQGFSDIKLTDATRTTIINCGSSGTSPDMHIDAGSDVATLIGTPNATVVASNKTVTIGEIVTSASISTPRAVDKVISAGQIDVAGASYVRLDTEAAASTDDLDTITGGLDGQRLVMHPVTTGRQPTITTAGNIATKSGSSVLLYSGTKTISLMYSTLASKWLEL